VTEPITGPEAALGPINIRGALRRMKQHIEDRAGLVAEQSAD
jgi:hypothetical protein